MHHVVSDGDDEQNRTEKTMINKRNLQVLGRGACYFSKFRGVLLSAVGTSGAHNRNLLVSHTAPTRPGMHHDVSDGDDEDTSADETMPKRANCTCYRERCPLSSEYF